MGNEKQLFTSEDKTGKVSEKKIFLSLIAEELHQHTKWYYQDDYLTVPCKLAKEYMEYTDSYWKTIETCLRDYGTISKEEFTERFKEIDLKSNKESLKDTIAEVLDYVSSKVGGRENSIPINIHTNRQATPLLLKMIDKMLVNQLLVAASAIESDDQLQKKEDEESTSNDKSASKRNEKIEKPKVLHVIDLPETTVQGIERSLRRIAEYAVVEDALDIIEDRIIFEGEYRFKKFVHNISEIYDDYILNSDTGKPKKSLLEKKDSTLINHVTSNYEFVGNRKYLKNKRAFESALRGSFLKKIKKTREDIKKEG